MSYNIKGTNIELSPELRDYIEKRLDHIEKLLSEKDVVQLDVELEYAPGDAGPKYRAEFTLANGGQTYRAEAPGATLHEAIDIAIGELTRELAKAKDKRTRLMRRSAARIKEFLRGWRKRF